MARAVCFRGLTFAVVALVLFVGSTRARWGDNARDDWPFADADGAATRDAPSVNGAGIVRDTNGDVGDDQGNIETDADELVQLDVGGVFMTTRRGTLLRYDNTTRNFFHRALYVGEEVEGGDSRPRSPIFVDADPKIFEGVLNILRQGTVATTNMYGGPTYNAAPLALPLLSHSLGLGIPGFQSVIAAQRARWAPPQLGGMYISYPSSSSFLGDDAFSYVFLSARDAADGGITGRVMVLSPKGIVSGTYATQPGGLTQVSLPQPSPVPGMNGTHLIFSTDLYLVRPSVSVCPMDPWGGSQPNQFVRTVTSNLATDSCMAPRVFRPFVLPEAQLAYTCSGPCSQAKFTVVFADDLRTAVVTTCDDGAQCASRAVAVERGPGYILKIRSHPCLPVDHVLVPFGMQFMVLGPTVTPAGGFPMCTAPTISADPSTSLFTYPMDVFYYS